MREACVTAAAVSAVIVALIGTITLVVRDLLWLRFCRYVYDDSVRRRRDPSAEETIRAAGEGRHGRPPEKRQLPGPSQADNKSPGE